ncbi:MAG: macro domain-containing protein [Candidatus Binataceae bacterium]
MVKVVTGDIFASNAQTLVNTVNCVGVMGKGIALEFKRRFPDMYEDYVARCRRGQVRLGEPYLFKGRTLPWVLNFPTKDDWRSLAKLSDIVRGLEYLTAHYRDWGIASLAVPPLGCGQGQLEWRVVGPTLYRYLKRLDAAVELYAPYGTPADQLEFDFLEGKQPREGEINAARESYRINPAWVGLVEILARISRQPYHWPVGRTMFQKIAYFATELGLPTGLAFQRASFGPFASGLKALESRLQNHDLIRERRVGRMLMVEPGSTYPDAAKRFASDLTKYEKVIQKVTDLFLRSDTRRAEIAATVHFSWKSLSASGDKRASERDVFEEVKRWKQNRRPPLREEDLAKTIRNLSALGWLDVSPSLDLPMPKDALLDA